MIAVFSIVEVLILPLMYNVTFVILIVKERLVFTIKC